MIRVLEIMEGGRVTVDARELFRVVADPDREIVGELLERREADVVATSYDICNPGEHARVIDYMQAFAESTVST